jgi:hypothetical protein
MLSATRTAKGSQVVNTLVLPMRGKISFVLYSEAGLETWAVQPFHIEGAGISIDGETGEDGVFEHKPVPYGDYSLIVGDAEFVIPAIPPDESPHPVHIPYDMLPEFAEWPGPTEEEELRLEGDEGEDSQRSHTTAA